MLTRAVFASWLLVLSSAAPMVVVPTDVVAGETQFLFVSGTSVVRAALVAPDGSEVPTFGYAYACAYPQPIYGTAQSARACVCCVSNITHAHTNIIHTSSTHRYMRELIHSHAHVL